MLADDVELGDCSLYVCLHDSSDYLSHSWAWWTCLYSGVKKFILPATENKHGHSIQLWWNKIFYRSNRYENGDRKKKPGLWVNVEPPFWMFLSANPIRSRRPSNEVLQYAQESCMYNPKEMVRRKVLFSEPLVIVVYISESDTYQDSYDLQLGVDLGG